MKNTFILLLFCLCLLTTAHSQEISLKYGKVTNDELTMKVYSKDTSATAVMLYDNGYSSYDYTTGSGFQIKTSYKKKIKILKQEGIDRASISIPYFFYNNGNKETIDGLEVTAYNLENGKIVKTKLEKNYLFTEDINSYFKQLKFTVPNVKVGTVIEYKYSKTTNNFSSLPDWEIQSDIPVLNSFFEVLVPEYFIFRLDTKGFEHVEIAETQENQSFSLVNSSGTLSQLSCTSRNLKISAKDVPALKDENFVWCINDFTSGVRFELSATKFPYDYYKPYTQTWEDLEKTLRNETDFVANIKTSNPYKEEIELLIKNITDKNQKIALIFNFVKKHIRWNKIYSFYGTNPKEAVKKGTGNNAQINIILMSALNDAGITTYPVLINRRSLGRLPMTYPSMNKLNTFIVAAETSDSTVTYLDGSSVFGGSNTLPTDLLVDRGYIFEPGHSEKWVNLTSIAKNEQKSYSIAKLDQDGNLKGETNTSYSNQRAYAYKSAQSSTKDSTEYIDHIQNSGQMTIDSFFVTGKDSINNKVKERLFFTKKIDSNGEYMYINPMIFTHLTENNFTQTERKLPVEFDYPYSYSSVCTILIPENYQIEELPKSMKIVLNDNKGSCIYQIGQSDNTIQLRYRFEMNETIFPINEYPSIRDFYGQIVVKNTEMIVLKKKQS